MYGCPYIDYVYLVNLGYWGFLPGSSGPEALCAGAVLAEWLKVKWVQVAVVLSVSTQRTPWQDSYN